MLSFSFIQMLFSIGTQENGDQNKVYERQTQNRDSGSPSRLQVCVRGMLCLDVSPKLRASAWGFGKTTRPRGHSYQWTDGPLDVLPAGGN